MPAKAIRGAAFQAIEGQGVVAFPGKIENVRRFELHAGCGFERFDAGGQQGIPGPGDEVVAVTFCHGLQFQFLKPRAGGTAVDVGDRPSSRLDESSLVGPWQEVAGPDLISCIRHGAGQHDEGRQVPVFTAKSITNP